MTPAQHKARGVLYVTQALNMKRDNQSLSYVKEKFEEARKKFQPDKGNDKDLLDKCEKHCKAVAQVYNLKRFVQHNFMPDRCYNLEGRFTEVLDFEQQVSAFFSEFLGDSFLVEEIHVSNIFYTALLVFLYDVKPNRPLTSLHVKSDREEAH